MTTLNARTVVVTDVPAAEELNRLGEIIGSHPLLIVPMHHDHRYATIPGEIEFQPPHVYVWHEEMGREFHRDLEKLAEEASSAIARAAPRLRGIQRALSFSLIDGALWDYLLLRRAATIVRSDNSTGNVILYFKNKRLQSAIQNTLEGIQGLNLSTADSQFRLAPIKSRESEKYSKLIILRLMNRSKHSILNNIMKMRRKIKDVAIEIIKISPEIPRYARLSMLALAAFWWRTAPRDIFVAAARRTAPLARRLSKTALKIRNNIRDHLYRLNPKITLKREIAQVLAPIIASCGSGSSPAVVCWISRDNNYAAALVRVIREIIPIRPVVLLLEGTGGDIIKRLEEFRNAPHSLHKIYLDDLYPIARRHLKYIVGTAADSLKKLSDRKELSSAERAILRHIIAPFLETSPQVHILGAVNEMMHQLTEVSPSYGILASGRSSTFAAVAEALNEAGRPTVDAHIYLVGNHARQIEPPTSYAAVIDDQQERLLSSFWKWPAERCIRVGYLWREPTAASPMARETSRAIVLICTQPGDSTMVKGFFSDVVSSLATLENSEVWLKPHPSETSATIDFYLEAMNAHELKGRSRVFSGKDQLGTLILAADIVVTRTSNAGIEAALLEKPTIRYLAYDKYDRGVEHTIAYARSLLSKDELQSCLADLVSAPSARAAQVASQSPYLRANPAQAAADGPSRLVAFLEKEPSSTDYRISPPLANAIKLLVAHEDAFSRRQHLKPLTNRRARRPDSGDVCRRARHMLQPITPAFAPAR